jgi:uncharacterized membrane protein
MVTAAITVPLALFLMLSETATGSFATVAYLRSRGLTRGFLKFMALTCAVFAGLALIVVLAGPPSAYRRVLSIDANASHLLGFLQAAVFVALVVHAVQIFKGRDGQRLTWLPTLALSALLVAVIALTLMPLGNSVWSRLAIGAGVLLSCAVLGAATTGMLLGHWYLVTPALTNRPLLRAIVVLLLALLAQALSFPLLLGSLPRGDGSVTHALGLSPVLAILWLLAGVAMPVLATALAVPTCRLRSFMSTTGLLYLALIAILPGQLIGLLLFFVVAA